MRSYIKKMLEIIGSDLWVRFYGVLAFTILVFVGLPFLGNILVFVLLSFLGPSLAGELRPDLLTALLAPLMMSGWSIMTIGLFFLRKWAAISLLFLTVIYSSGLISQSILQDRPELAPLNRIRILFALGITLFPAITIAAAWTKLKWKGRWQL